MTRMNLPAHTPDSLKLQTTTMWDAVAHTLTLDAIVCMRELSCAVVGYLNTVEANVGKLAYIVASRVMDEYVGSRLAAAYMSVREELPQV